MKLRIRGNSIRLRVTRGELEQLGMSGSLEEVVEFGIKGPKLGYRLLASAAEETVRAKFEDDCLCIWVPKHAVDNWINSEQVGIESGQPIGDGRSLRILVEKDFACLTPRADEDEADAFPNPSTGISC